MWLVDIALRRPYTYLVMALMILLATPFVLRSTPTDIFPDIKIPVVSVVWNYTGMAPKDMRERIVSPYEKALTTTVNDVEHIESLPYDFVDVPGMLKVKTIAGDKSPVEVSAEILARLRQRAEDSCQDEIVGAVITVPAYFDDAQRQATKDAAKLAGIEVYRLLNEPTAAAIAYGLDQKAEGTYAVFDLGGGTFDISILKL